MGHHYVPQHYLRGFATNSDAGEIWQFDKATGRYSTRPLSIVTVAQQRRFFDTLTEQRLAAEVEGPTIAILERLRNSKSRSVVLLEAERWQLATYIATMMLRVPHSRARANAMLPEAIDSVTSELRTAFSDLADAGEISSDLSKKRISEIAAAAESVRQELPANIKETIESPWPRHNLIEMLVAMEWFFARAPSDESFITSDNPGFFFPEFGLGTPNSEFTFPVASDLALFGSRRVQTKGKRVVSLTKFVREANRRLIGSATRFIYSCAAFPWVAEMSQGIPRLNQIGR